MNVLALTALLLALSCPLLAGASADTTAPAAHFQAFDPKADAARDIGHAIEKAGPSGKKILLDVGGNWCKWCKMLDTFFVAHKDVALLLDKHYVVVKVNFSKENENKEVLSRYPKAAGYPHFYVLNADGSLLHSQNTAELEKGQGYDPREMKAFLTKWAE